MSFCTKCGEKLDEGEMFCTVCGEPVDEIEETELPETTPTPEPPPEPEPVKQPQPIQEPNPVYTSPPPERQPAQSGQMPIKFDVPDEDNATVTIAGKQLKVGLIMKVAALIICLCFFLPFFNVTIQGESMSFSVSSVITQPGNFWLVIFLLIPAAIFAIYQFKNKLSFLTGKLFIIAIIISVIGIIIKSYYANSMMDFLKHEFRYDLGYVTFGTSFWFWLSLLLYIIIGVLAVMCIRTLKNNNQ